MDFQGKPETCTSRNRISSIETMWGPRDGRYLYACEGSEICFYEKESTRKHGYMERGTRIWLEDYGVNINLPRHVQ